MKHILSLLSLVIGLAVSLNAAGVEFQAQGPRAVQVGEQFQITYTINEQPSGFRPPEFKGLSLLGGPSTSTSSSVQIINGRMTQSSTISYTYFLTGNSPGTFSFEGAKATVDGKTYSSNGLTIEVVKGNSNQSNNANQQQSQSGNNAGGGNAAAEIGNEDIFVRVLIDKTTLYQGEHVVASIKLYSRLNISAIENIEYPSFNGFFRQDIETAPLRNLERENINGTIYGTGVIQRMVLFPTKNGEITINPLTLQCVVQQQVRGRQRSVFDDFWGPQVQEVRKKIVSRPIKINVKALPSNAPAAFKGAVGDFNFKASIDKNHVKSNDAISLKVTIAGNGNLKMIESLPITFPADFETYDPKVSVNTSTSNGGVSGSKSFEYLIIPRHSGQFKIPALEFVYFDTKSKKYKTLSSQEFDITVDKGADEGANSVVASVSKEDVKFIGKDIRFIKTANVKFINNGAFFIGSTLFYLLYLIAILIFAIVVIAMRKRIRDNANVVLVKNKKANKIARKRLSEAANYLKHQNKDLFYENINKALFGYMADKLSIPFSELTRERMRDEAAKRNISNELIEKFLELADTCEYARFAPGDVAAQMDNVFNAAVDVITNL